MTALRVAVSLSGEGEVRIEGAEAHYLLRVHRVPRGGTFLAFDPEARLEADAVLTDVRGGVAVCEVSGVRPAGLVANRPLWLLQGISKGDRFDLVVRDACALGVTDIVPVATTRCAVNAREGQGRLERWKKIAVASARQCGRGDLPRVHVPVGLVGAMRMPPEQSVRLCLWEESARPIAGELEKLAGGMAVALLIGPEGGLEAGEVEQARGAGFADVSLGPYVLRTETAATAVLGVVMAWRERGLGRFR